MVANPIRHGRASKRSKTIEERCATGDFREHNGHKPLENGHRLGDLLGLLFRLILQYLGDNAFLSRCNRPDGTLPKAATEPTKFHRQHYRPFASAHADWPNLVELGQRQVLRSYLFRLWTTDPRGEVMRPKPPVTPKLCRASWAEFWMTDAELDSLVHWVVANYRAGAAHVLA